MGSVKISRLALVAVFGTLLALLWATKDFFLAAHSNDLIYYFSSDGAEYLKLYDTFYSDVSLGESPTLFLVGSPILLMKLAGGELWIVQSVNLALMALTMWIVLPCLPDLRSRLQFLAGVLVFPYFVFGFMSLNKEVYAMCSAILLCAYYARGNKLHLVLVLILAGLARYYMLLSIIFLLFMVPRTRVPRYRGILAVALVISIFGPVAKSLIPDYSKEEVLDVSGITGIVFAAMIDHGGYFIAYPIKYLFLIPQRIYSWFIDPTRQNNAMEAVVSLTTMVALYRSSLLSFSKQFRDSSSFKLVIAGAVAPLPMMWGDIMHWRYFSFVYFFYLFGVVQYRAITRQAAPTSGGNV
jgi:hypothetical protein